jgi:integrase/recombinase XerC
MENDKLVLDFVNYLKRKGKAKSTLIAYQNDLKQLAESNVNKLIIDFQEADVKHGLNFLQSTYSLSSKTVSRKLNSIRTFYRFLQERKYVESNPTESIVHPKFRVKKQRFLSRQEYLALREVSRENPKIYMVIELLLQTGLRIGEVSRLKVKDIVFSKDGGFIYVEKFASNPERRVPINAKLSIELKDYLTRLKASKKVNTPLFATKTGKGIEVRNIRGCIDRFIIRAKIKSACVNDLRNTFIVNQLSSGFSVSRLAEIVGHKNTTTTTKYIELLGKKYKPTAIEKLVEL